MPLDADTIVDRRRLRRKLTFWRVFAFLLVAAVVVGGGYAVSNRGSGLMSRPGAYIARVKIQGIIRGDSERVESLERLAKSSARAVVVHVDSPGGTTAGSEQLHDALRKVANAKPLVVVVDGLAASGGYMAAMSSDHIVAQSSSLVGSIGVIFQFPNVSELLKTVGVKVEEVKSSPLKAAPNGFEPTSPEARAALESIVRDSYAWFKDLVAARRKLTGTALDQVSDGRVFTGRQAVDLKLIDELGDEHTAIAWLAKEKNIDAKTPVRDWKLDDRLGDLSFLHLGAAAIFDALGMQSLAQRLLDAGTMQAIERMNLDGLLALWHPATAN
ncbi:MAG: signal peptide peptidase SppA [Rhizomicrobium sp.]